jgi:hypothetical protein
MKEPISVLLRYFQFGEPRFVFSHYLFIAFLAFVSYLFGRRLTQRLNYHSVWEEVGISTALGLGVIAYLVFFLGLLGVLYPAVMWAALIVGALGCYPVWMVWVRQRNAWWTRWKSAKNIPGLVVVFTVVIGALSLILSLLPLYPPTYWDDTEYHLACAKVYVQNHRMIFTPFLRYPTAPQINEMLFAWALLLSDDITAQLTQFLMMLVVAVMLFAWGRRILSPRAGLWAAALWLGSPHVIYLGASAYIDVGLACFVTAAAYAFFNWVANKEQGWLILSGVFAGFAASTKYSALFFVGIFGLATLYLAIRERRWTYPLIFGATAIGVVAPWYLRNLYYTGNPVFPFFGQIFGYGIWNEDDLRGILHDMKRFGHGKTLTSFSLLLYHLAYNQGAADVEAVSLRKLLLVLPALVMLAVVLIRSERLRGISLISVAFVLFWFLSVQVVRYLLPVLPMVSLVKASVVDQSLEWLSLSQKKWTIYAVIAALGAVLFLRPGWLYVARRVVERGPVPATQAQRDAYLMKRLPSPTYHVYQFLNRQKGRNYRLYALYDENMAYFADGVFMGDWFGPARYARITNNLTSGQALYRELKQLDADYFLVTNHRPKLNVNLPQDDFFRRHFKLVHSGSYPLLFEIQN